MNTTTGIQNEENFVNAINGHKLSEMNNNIQYFLRTIYPFAENDDIFYCYRTEDFIKPDICIEWRNENTFVSLKFGVSNTIHGESTESFVNFLRSLGTSERAIKIIKLFAFGDGTTDGTGEVRKSGIEVRYELRKEIIELNKELNSNKQFIKDVVDRLLFQGVDPLAYKAKYVYHGSIEYGDFVSRKQVLKHIDNKTWAFMDCPHIGPIVFRPHARYAEKTILNEKHRKELVFTWPNLIPDIRYIAKRYNW